MILPGTGRGTAPAGRGGGGARQVPRPEMALARKLRRQMSYPEVLLWQRRRGGGSGTKIRKGHPIGPYAADFYCAALRLVVEVDGGIHAQPEAIAHDTARDRFMIENGDRVVRVNASDIMKDADAAAASIGSLAARPLHRPAATACFASRLRCCDVPPAHRRSQLRPPPRAGED